MSIIKSVLILLVGAALATFLWSNFEQTVIIYFTTFFRTVEIPLAAALVGSIVTGFLFAVTMSLPNQFRLRSRIREQQQKIDRLEDELRGLRKIPLNDAFPDTASSESTEKLENPGRSETHGS